MHPAMTTQRMRRTTRLPSGDLIGRCAAPRRSAILRTTASQLDEGATLQPETAETPTSGAPAVPGVIEEMRRHYSPPAGGETVTMLLTLTGDGGGTWLLRAGEELEAQLADPASPEAVAHVEMDVTTLRRLFSGEANRFDAVLDGRIRVRGDLDEAARLSWAFHRSDAAAS